jgi:membrane-associated phospholipid phosphatase
VSTELALPNPERLRTYGSWAARVGITFSAVYPTLNWLTSVRERPYQLYVAAELSVPFVPELIWVYLSMYVLFLMPLLLLPAARMAALGKQLIAGTLIGGVVFLVLPAELGFARTIPEAPRYAEIYAALFRLDFPYNLVPSLHVFFSAAIAMACADIARLLTRITMLAWLAAIAASTVLIHQHHILDLAAAFILVVGLRHIYEVSHA